MKFYGILALALAFLGLSQASYCANKGIFGSDDRVEYYQVPEGLRTIADSTPALWKKNQMWPGPSAGTYNLATGDFGEMVNLCPGEKFADQPTGAFCSGALVGEDLVLTAGHCVVTQADCDGMAVVFGFAIKGPGEQAPAGIPEKDVYFCSRIVTRQPAEPRSSMDSRGNTADEPDYALIRLDRKVAGRQPLAINRQRGLKKGARLFIAGYPNGLSFKFAANGRVVKSIDPTLPYFRTNLDTFPSNSGSPVINADTLLIEGVHATGDRENFIPTFEGCYIYSVRPENAGFATRATKIDYLLDSIPPTPLEAAAAAKAKAALKPLRTSDFATQKTVTFN